MKSIHDYIENVLQNPKAAANLIDTIEKKIERLSFFPKIGPIVDRQPWTNREIRKIKVKNYYVFYKIIEEESLVTIIGISYCRMN